MHSRLRRTAFCRIFFQGSRTSGERSVSTQRIAAVPPVWSNKCRAQPVELQGPNLQVLQRPLIVKPQIKKSSTLSTTISLHSFNGYGQADSFAEIIDVRTPAEFAEDHIIGAVNLPVLSDAQRVEVGTLYTRNQLAARKLGAALISQNISSHIVNHFHKHDRNYSPLIYCWRGGQRSRSMALILKEIGFQPAVLTGGYKAYRKYINNYIGNGSKCNDFETKLDGLKFLLISGATGSGKTLILNQLSLAGQNTIDLEKFASHKGSVLGCLPEKPQPSQKYFESQIVHHIQTQLNAESIVWVENESNRIGNLSIPIRLWAKMLGSRRIQIDVDLDERIQYILRDYDYLCNPAMIEPLLLKLKKHVGAKTTNQWKQFLGNGEFTELVRSLIQYYDSSYKAPRGTPVRKLSTPSGYLLHSALKEESDSFLEELITAGQDHFINKDNETLSVKKHVFCD